MNPEPVPSKTTKATKKPLKMMTISKVIQDHFSTVLKGTFDATKFTADLQTIPSEDVDCKKCVKSLMKLTKNTDKENNSSKVNSNVEKMTDILMEKFTVKKPGICDVLFFPSMENEAKIIEHLKAAKKSIYVCMFTITNERLCSAMLEACHRGVEVRIVIDDEELRMMGNYVMDLCEEGATVRTDNSTRALMHHKFAIIDQKILMTGSYNWTVRASKANLENVVVVDSQELVTIFVNEFDRLWKEYSAQTITAEGNQKLKTRLYQKYKEGIARVEKQKLKEDMKKKMEEVEKATGVIPKSKKISKLPKSTAPKNTKKSKKGTGEDEDEVDKKAEEKSDGISVFLQVGLKLLYLFILIALTSNLARGTWLPHHRG